MSIFSKTIDDTTHKFELGDFNAIDTIDMDKNRFKEYYLSPVFYTDDREYDNTYNYIYTKTLKDFSINCYFRHAVDTVTSKDMYVYDSGQNRPRNTRSHIGIPGVSISGNVDPGNLYMPPSDINDLYTATKTRPNAFRCTLPADSADATILSCVNIWGGYDNFHNIVQSFGNYGTAYDSLISTLNSHLHPIPTNKYNYVKEINSIVIANDMFYRDINSSIQTQGINYMVAYKITHKVDLSSMSEEAKSEFYIIFHGELAAEFIKLATKRGTNESINNPFGNTTNSGTEVLNKLIEEGTAVREKYAQARAIESALYGSRKLRS